MDNDTSEQVEERSHEYDRLPSSFLLLNDEFTTKRTYRCIPTNAVAVGEYCEIVVAGMCQI